jgi:rhomboid protease GluP
MSESSIGPTESAATAAQASSAQEFSRWGDSSYRVRFSRFWSGSQLRNSFNLARRGELRFSGDTLTVHAFQREFGSLGSRIELKFPRAEIADVFQQGNVVSFRVVHPNRDPKILSFWTENEEDAKKIVEGLPNTESAAGIAVKEYQAHLNALDRGDYVTKVLVAANVLTFGVAGALGAGFVVPHVEVLQTLGTNFGPLTIGGQWWRLVTSLFLHFGVFHLALNMWALLVGGRLAERLFGGWAFALIYFAAGIAGSLNSLLWHPNINSAGASGAIFGVYGAMLAFHLRRHTAIPADVLSQQRLSGIIFIGYNLLNGFSHAGIDNAAHLGGLGVGFALGILLALPLGLESRAQLSGTRFYTRGVIAAVTMIGALFGLLWLSNGADQRLRRDLYAIGQSEDVALSEANQLFKEFRRNEITAAELAQRIDSEILPRWIWIQKTVEKDRVADDSPLKPMWGLLSDYSESRVAAFQLFESGYRLGKEEDLRAAQAKLDQGDIDVNLLKEMQRQK